MMKSKPLEASQLVRGRGRPPKDPTKGMRQNCTFRLPENTRNKLLLAAVASNRSLSEEIEYIVDIVLEDVGVTGHQRVGAGKLECCVEFRQVRIAAAGGRRGPL